MNKPVNLEHLSQFMGDAVVVSDVNEKIVLWNPAATRIFGFTEAEALGHKNNLQSLEKSLTDKIDETNPYQEQIEELKKTAIQQIDWAQVNLLTKLKML